MQPADVGKLHRVSDPRIHPDGQRVAFTVTAIDLDEDRYVSEIWLWDGETARAFTGGPKDSSPRWSPDGGRLAFLRAGPADSDKPQVAVMAADGGEASVITEFSLGATAPEWAPDGSRLAVVGTTWIDDWADLDDDERKRKPRRITVLPYRGDNQGWLHDRRSHIYLVSAGSDPECLTPGDFNEAAPAWHPSADRLAFISARHATRGLDPGSQVVEVGVGGGDAVPVGDVGAWSTVSYSPDGALHAVGHVGRYEWPAVTSLFRRDGDQWVDLTGHLDRGVTTFSPPLSPETPQWSADGAALGYLVDSGRIRAVRFDGDEPTTLVGGDRLVTGFSIRPDGSAIAFTATAVTDPGELWWAEGGEEHRVTALNEGFRSTVPLVEPEEVTIDTEDGAVHGWVYLPPGDDPVKVLFNIHGGPASQYGVGFFDEFQVYVAAGYGVVACNPRGSDGYGHDHVRGVVGEWQKDDPADLRDLRGFLAGVLERHPRLDREHVGVMGGSYGGLITVRILAVDGSFTSAIAERGLYDWISFAGASDIGPWFDRLYVDAQLPDGDDALWRASSLSHAGTVTTPTLIIHSGSDFRTPIDQGQQLYVLLRRLGVETELLWFPGEGHEMSRSGKPRHRVERFEAILDWHATHC